MINTDTNTKIVDVLFLRDEGSDGVTTAAAMSFTVDSSRFATGCDDNEAMILLLTEAVTDWVRHEPDGLALWDESCEDLNIGDLLNDGIQFDLGRANCSLHRTLEKHGIFAVGGGSLDIDGSRSYDEVLVNRIDDD